MSTSTRSKITTLFTLLVVFLTAFQGLIPTLPISNVSVIATISAITMFLVSGLTTWKQFLSNEIDNAALKPTIIVAIIATIGGLNELFNVVHFSAVADQWVRFTITLITMFLNVASKILWPTTETKTTI